MKIYRNDYNTPQMQIEENKKNIELLASIIKDAYNSNVQLLTTDVSIAISDTDAPVDTTDGWLFDPNGKLFKITSGDGTNLLIEFYSDFKGKDGHDGSDSIDDSTTAIDKVWSSDKTNNEIINAKDKGIYYTTTQPSVVGANLYYLDFENNILNKNTNIPIVEKDLVFYIDGNNKVIELYRVTGTNSLTKIGDFGGGKQLYQHNIEIYKANNIEAHFTIINDSNTQLSTYNNLNAYLNQNVNLLREVSGFKITSSQGRTIVGIYGNNTTYIYISTWYQTTRQTETIDIDVDITDVVIPL